MSRNEKIPLVGSQPDENFYTGEESSTNEGGTSGRSGRILHILTIISVLVACGSTIYGIFNADTPLIALPFIVVILWVFIHFLLVFFARRPKHDFHPPAWFMFVSSGHIFIQALIVIILTLFKRPT